GESVSEGIISRWHKADGSMVKAGEPLFELETDKATSDVPAAGSGVLRIAVQEGATVAVGATVATIEPAPSEARAEPTPTKEPSTTTAKKARPAPAAEAPSSQEKDEETSSAAVDSTPASAVKSQPLSPAVRRLVSEEGIDASQITATGRSGRLTKGDVLNF